MAGVKIKAAANNGSAEIAGPPDSSANTVLKLPADTGAAGKVLKVKSANHSSTNAELEWGASDEFVKVKLDGTTNSSKAVGDMWYESSTGKFHFAGSAFGEGVWAAGTNINNTRYIGTGVGELYAGMIVNGYNHPTYSLKTEEYDGTTWTTTGDTTNGVYQPGSFGVQNTAVKFAGYNGSYGQVTCEEYDGSAWSAGTTIDVARMGGMGCGVLTAGLAIGGRTANTTYVATTSEYDGTTWSAGGTIGWNSYDGVAAGTQTAATYAGGYNNSDTAFHDTAEYDGTSWTASNDMGVRKYGGGGGGVQNSIIFANGYDESDLDKTTQIYNGTTWSAGNVNITSFGGPCGSNGNGSNAYMAGGYTGSLIANTEEFEITANTALIYEVVV